MTEQAPAATAAALFEAYSSGDLDATVALFHEHATIDIPGDPAVPWTGERRGRSGVREFFRLLHEHVQPEAFEIDKILADENTAVALGRFTQRIRRGGATFTSEYALRLEVEDGLIVRYLMLEDSCAVAEAVGGALAVSA
jgi:uncharacterized protein